MRESGGGCCGGQEAGSSVDERRVLGERRRSTVRRALLIGSVTLGVAGVAVALFGPSATVSARLHWAAALCAAGLVGGWVRQAMTTHRPGWRLVLAVSAIAVGLVWNPAVAALGAVVALAEHVLRREPTARVAEPEKPAVPLAAGH